MTRRNFIWICFLIGACAGAATSQDLKLNVVTEDHPHLYAIRDAQVKANGCELHFSTQSLESIRKNLTAEKKPDIAEVELLPYMIGQSAGELTDYVLIPVFPSRAFQLRNIYVRTDRNIHNPGDLRGKTIGVSGYSSTTPTWIRGLAQSSWSVKPEEMTWRDAQQSSGTVQTLWEWLASGQVDVVLTPGTLPTSLKQNPKIDRLYPDFPLAENQNFSRRRLFPIITALAVRRELVVKNPWLAESLFFAFAEAKRKAYANQTMPLPWEHVTLEQTEEIMGKNFWSYGVKNNPKTLGAIFSFAFSQGLLAKKLTFEDVFDPSTLQLIDP